MKKFKNFRDKSKTDSYPPPKYVIEPAPGDKGFALISSYMKKMKKILEPGIWSTSESSTN
jgi:hypothetical protein